MLEKTVKMKMTYKIKLLVLSVLCSIKVIGQNKIEITKLDANKIPSEIKFSGKIKNAICWNDKLGKNIVLTSETGEFESKNSENNGRDAEVYAYHYIILENSTKLNWKIYDFIKDCPVDIEASFIENTLNVTDLNKNGIAEIWIMYKTVCHGDVSPCEMKIIMYEESKKFAMRGENRVQLSKTEFEGGKYKFDKAFNEAPKEYREYAKRLWKKNINQRWK